MPNESIDLLDTIQEIQSEFREDTHEDIPIVNIQKNLETIDDILVTVLNAPKNLSKQTIFQTNSRLRSHVFVDIQQVRQFRENLKSEAIPTDLYYFLLDVFDDFGMKQPIVLSPRREISIREVANHFDAKFEIERHDSEFYKRWKRDLKSKKCHVIGFPISEMRNPMNFALLAHECLHAANAPTAHDQKYWEYFCDEYAPSLHGEIDEGILEEVVLDIISLNYLGPVYALRVSQLPKRLGHRSSSTHMGLVARVWYGIKYLEYIEGESEWWEERHPMFEEIRQVVLSELEDRYSNFPDSQKEEFISDFQSIQAGVEEMFTDHAIPSYINEITNLKEYLGMPSAGDGKVSDKLDIFLLNEDRDKKLAMPLKPCILLNSLVLYDWEQVTDLREPVLLSFKKWYVTKKTIYS